MICTASTPFLTKCIFQHFSFLVLLPFLQMLSCLTKPVCYRTLLWCLVLVWAGFCYMSKHMETVSSGVSFIMPYNRFALNLCNFSWTTSAFFFSSCFSLAMLDFMDSQNEQTSCRGFPKPKLKVEQNIFWNLELDEIFLFSRLIE